MLRDKEYKADFVAMNIVFSRHAKAKMIQRSIPASIVIGAVRFPDFRFPGRSGRKELYKSFRKIYLKVIIKETAIRVIVVTAHLVAKVPKN